MSVCDDQWMLDINDRYQKGVGVVISLSTASYILPILFLKDVVSIGNSQSLATHLSIWVYGGWLALGVSVLSGIFYYYCSAKWVKIAWGQSADICGIGVKRPFIEKLLDSSYFLLMTGFVSGLSCMVYFMVTFTSGDSSSIGTE